MPAEARQRREPRTLTEGQRDSCYKRCGKTRRSLSPSLPSRVITSRMLSQENLICSLTSRNGPAGRSANKPSRVFPWAHLRDQQRRRSCACPSRPLTRGSPRGGHGGTKSRPGEYATRGVDARRRASVAMKAQGPGGGRGARASRPRPCSALVWCCRLSRAIHTAPGS